MPKACSWSSPPEEISPHLWAKFSTLYDAPSDIDLFSAGLAETLLPGAHVGPTFACIIGRQVGHYSKGFGNNTLGLCYTREQTNLLLSQFKALKEGDRFFFTNNEGTNPNPFTPDQLINLKVTHMT